MTPTTIPPPSALRRGIKDVGIGKKGSRSLSREHAQEILEELKKGLFTPASRAAFFTALTLKGITEEESILTEYFPSGTMTDNAQLVEALCGDAPAEIREICFRLLEKKEISRPEAYQLGRFLLSDHPSDGARGLAAIALRVRYESLDEYLGLLDAVRETITPPFRVSTPAGHPIIQLAEPFDGVDHNYMITPVIADRLQKDGFRVVSLIGRNSGPKLVNNLYDLIQYLGIKPLPSSGELTDMAPRGGFFIDQRDLSPALNRWVDLRHEIVKRPFLATLEKFVDPCKADILITSAFHGVYGEKMAAIAEGAGFSSVIVVRNGVEGTIAFPLTRPAKLLLSARQKNGAYLRHEMVVDPAQILGPDCLTETKLDNPSLKINARLIQDFLLNTKSGDREFDDRCHVTTQGLIEAIRWIRDHHA